MTVDSAALLGLAAKVEEAASPSGELFAEIWRTLFTRPERIWEDEDREEWTSEYERWQERQSAFWTFMEARAWIDAAVSLVPEGFGWRLWMPARSQSGDGDQPRVTIWGPAQTYAPRDLEAATPALALTASCLRAHATHAGSVAGVALPTDATARAGS